MKYCKKKNIYVFIVHSQITVRISEIIISKLNVSKKYIFFIVFRGTKVNSNLVDNVIDANDSESQDLIDKLSNYNSFLYVPHLENKTYLNLVKMSSCVGYYLIEEGFLSYTDLCDRYFARFINSLSYKNLIYKLWHVFKFRITKKKYLGAYTITSKAFFGYPNKNTLDNVFIEKKTEIKNIIVAPLIMNILGDENKMNEFFLFIDKIMFNKNTFVKIKLHPSQNQFVKEKNKIESIIFKYKKIELMDNDVLLEDFITNKKLKFYIFDPSSILIYLLIIGKSQLCVTKKSLNQVARLLQLTKLPMDRISVVY